MKLWQEWTNFNNLDSVLILFNSLYVHIAIILFTNFVLFYVVLKIVTYFFIVRSNNNKTNSLATKYFFATSLVVSEFIVLIILQIMFFQIFKNIIDINIYFINDLVLILNFFITIIVLLNKQILNYILKLTMAIVIAILSAFLITNQLLIWCYYINDNHALILWLTWNILVIFIVIIFYLFDLKPTFLHDYALQMLIFLVSISNVESGSADLKILDQSLFLKIILKIIKVLCLLDLFFLIKTVKKTMKNLWKINNDKTINLVTLLLFNNIRFFNISEKNGLENLPNKFLKNEINGWRGILQE